MPIETQPAVAELRKRDGEALYLHGDLPIQVRELADRPAVQDLLGRCEFYIHGCGDRLMAFQYERASVSQLERLLAIADDLPTAFCQSS